MCNAYYIQTSKFESVRHAVWFKNRTSTRALQGKMPYKNYMVDYQVLNADWNGNLVYILNEDTSKLNARSDKGVGLIQ